MARVRYVAQGIHDPDIKAAEGIQAGLWQAVDVARIAEPAEAIAKRMDVAMLLQHRQGGDRAAGPVNDYRLAGDGGMALYNGGIFASRRGLETIAEFHMHLAAGCFIEIDIHAPARLDE